MVTKDEKLLEKIDAALTSSLEWMCHGVVAEKTGGRIINVNGSIEIRRMSLTALSIIRKGRRMMNTIKLFSIDGALLGEGKSLTNIFEVRVFKSVRNIQISVNDGPLLPVELDKTTFLDDTIRLTISNMDDPVPGVALGQ